jgi:ubiquinone/menaquinone biosynthesis C-methylase UbiE
MNAEDYENWYATPRGRWIAETEFALLMQLLQPKVDTTLLDVGSGTGQFSRRFAHAGLDVVSLDPALDMLAVARRNARELPCVRGNALALPFRDRRFDYVAAVTSLCFVEPPARALAEMWRVCRRGVVLGLLNRRSLLYSRKHGRGGYRGARWDRLEEVRDWCNVLDPRPRVSFATGVFLPDGGWLARSFEAWLPAAVPWGGFLAVALHRPDVDLNR